MPKESSENESRTSPEGGEQPRPDWDTEVPGPTNEATELVHREVGHAPKLVPHRGVAPKTEWGALVGSPLSPQMPRRRL
eukprot:14942260-Alexandrium_andersonii.AAC.1